MVSMPYYTKKFQVQFEMVVEHGFNCCFIMFGMDVLRLSDKEKHGFSVWEYSCEARVLNAVNVNDFYYKLSPH